MTKQQIQKWFSTLEPVRFYYAGKWHAFFRASNDSFLYIFEVEDENYKFKGFIDRIDKNPDGSYSIYDYKTGNAKGLNLICPNGKNENYYIQIGLYKYFFEKITKNKVNKTGFIFPEDFSGNLEINFTDEEIKNIIEKFKSTIKSIKNHEFEPNYKNANCEYCAYRDFCALNII